MLGTKWQGFRSCTDLSIYQVLFAAVPSTKYFMGHWKARNLNRCLQELNSAPEGSLQLIIEIYQSILMGQTLIDVLFMYCHIQSWKLAPSVRCYLTLKMRKWWWLAEVKMTCSSSPHCLAIWDLTPDDLVPGSERLCFWDWRQDR